MQKKAKTKYSTFFERTNCEQNLSSADMILRMPTSFMGVRWLIQGKCFIYVVNYVGLVSLKRIRGKGLGHLLSI
ncbi:MAG TPA: hypothetical protein VK487_11665 [Candidatus Bathyarchaeia archaeon]|nr:hypothetical protein [Candidatus Bathyarchaeia archaeon]